MKKILIVETNIQNYQGTHDPTGLWLGETVEFVDEIQRFGFDIDYVSPNGGFIPLDPRSMKYTDDSIMALYRNPSFIEKALRNTLKPSEVNPNDYIAIYYTGGHGVMWDFPDNKELKSIARAIYTHHGYLLSVCHGIAGLLNLKDDKGNFIIKDKNITGFTTTEEFLAGKTKIVPFLNQHVATSHGAKFQKKRFYTDFAITDGRIITGQNPFSVRSVARQFIQEIKK
ncbi:type 1 glutamine amidotransferase domain-containing protein [Weissella coleopterorum]|uniref:Type 1 glutamine amidotransferase domain-containing protein n=1 Tax=Weissella coleopterorum TaxID=2714949 RepID=A0A6G8AZ33_9LACO|nr:type 1 glutamine amidotransferase domain-containing protein [Weissella coleopterorum]QIL50324.1 type 1 glutamine amidotransferase domain-containing protein [Weissella coleopterorum]